MTVIHVDFAKRRRSFDLSEKLASIRLAVIRSERLADELEQLEQTVRGERIEIRSVEECAVDLAIRNNPRPVL